MTNQWEQFSRVIKSDHPFPIRILKSVVPVVVVILPMLWIKGYPPEEWPFIAGVFMLGLWIGGIAVCGPAVLAVKLLHQYARAVAARAGLEVAEPVDESPSMLGARIASVLIAVLLLQLAAWGLGLCALGVVVRYMGMPSLGDRFLLVPAVLAVLGVLGFSMIIAVLAWFFRTMDREPSKIPRFANRFRNRLRLVVEMGRNVNSPSGVPLRVGRMRNDARAA